MNIAFRVDASVAIGSGHMMRCLTLADRLKSQGFNCHFVCREHKGNLHSMVTQRGHQLHSLPVVPAAMVGVESGDLLVHSAWLQSTQQEDATQTSRILKDLRLDWLVVDHYALDQRWEYRMRDITRKLLVIDDLADRKHHCDVLLDQNLGRSASDYSTLVQANCQVLAGPAFALLRPEFPELREISLERRIHSELKNILISMGGLDPGNATIGILQALQKCNLPSNGKIIVVMGAQSLNLEQIRKFSAGLPYPIEVKFNISNMGEVMAESDLAIGAAGSTSWERCCLGLPTLQLVLAENQKSVADALINANAALPLSIESNLPVQLSTYIHTFLSKPALLKSMSKSAAGITDGNGCARVYTALTNRRLPPDAG